MIRGDRPEAALLHYQYVNVYQSSPQAQLYHEIIQNDWTTRYDHLHTDFEKAKKENNECKEKVALLERANQDLTDSNYQLTTQLRSLSAEPPRPEPSAAMYTEGDLATYIDELELKFYELNKKVEGGNLLAENAKELSQKCDTLKEYYEDLCKKVETKQQEEKDLGAETRARDEQRATATSLFEKVDERKKVIDLSLDEEGEMEESDSWRSRYKTLFQKYEELKQEKHNLVNSFKKSQYTLKNRIEQLKESENLLYQYQAASPITLKDLISYGKCIDVFLKGTRASH